MTSHTSASLLGFGDAVFFYPFKTMFNMSFSTFWLFTFLCLTSQFERFGVLSFRRFGCRRFVGELWNITEKFNVLHQDNWTVEANRIVKNFTEEIYLATKRHGWDGKIDKNKEDWSLPGSLLFCITVITTIGIN